ncbi:hypothetical protein CH35J_006547 [Colletotrichum higginsianum]|uniref:F-box domain-containing protein n=1 Tax=Colletotrichum higginsianum TaxID=80884 RepID=A0A4T0VX03_9PEZI|nr:hypothetical protein CH35J_006547 [Colletotrichum higginsianum]
MVSRLKALHFPRLVAFHSLEIETGFQISLLKHLAQNTPALHTIQVDTWPENGSILTVLSRFARLTELDVDLAYGVPRAVDGLEEDSEDDERMYPEDTRREAGDATVWKNLRKVSLFWGRIHRERIPLKMMKTLARCERLTELRLWSNVCGDGLMQDSDGLRQRNVPFHALRTLELWAANRRAWERVGAMSCLRSLTLNFCPGGAEPEDLLCISPLEGLMELNLVQHEAVSRAAFRLTADHLLDMTTLMKGLESLRYDLVSGSLGQCKGLTERITGKHPNLKELRFGFGVYLSDEILLASSSSPRNQSLRRLFVSTTLAANETGEHDDGVVGSYAKSEQAANAFKTLFPQLKVFRSTEDCYEKVYQS